MRYLWTTSYAILIAGALLMAAGTAGKLGPIATVGGLLLLWTGIVKIVVLRIWKRSLPSQGALAVTAKAETVGQSTGSPR